MFKKIELWVLLIICIFFFIALICYGAILKHHYTKGNKFKLLQTVAVFIAEIPSNINKSLKGEQNKMFTSNKHLNKKKFKNFLKLQNNDNLLILSRFDGDIGRSVVEIIDMNNFEVIHEYKHNVNLMNEKIDTSKPQFKRAKIDQGLERFIYVNPLISKDASLISHSGGPLFKIDVCSDLIWMNQDYAFRHALNFDEDETIWAMTVMYPYSKHVSKFREEYGYRDDAITKLNKEGKIIYNKSFIEILIENNFHGQNLFYGDIYDPAHINDIEPALFDSNFWKKGDVFISARHLSAIIHFRPSTNKIVNYITGPFHQQHDIDIISNKEISIFNNNNSVLQDSKNSNILIYNFENKLFTKKFNNELIKENFKTETQGISEILKDGSILVEEQNHGRLIFLNKNGEKLWEYVNKTKKNETYLLFWSRIIENKKLVYKIKESINNKNC